jgi:polyisoprenoid-binding protein YceI
MQTTSNIAKNAKRDLPADASTQTKWKIDAAHTSVGFSVRHMMVSNVRGEFQKVSGSALWDPNRPDTSKVEVAIDVASINTREPQRDAHLRSADFFDAEHYPSITFVSRGIGRSKDGVLEIVGDLTIRGTTRVIALAIEGPTEEHADPWGGIRIGASATTSIKRSDFGMTWNSLLETGGVVVGDEIKIHLDVELVKEQG